jgi:dihydroxyacetone kinase-like predicted kinase
MVRTVTAIDEAARGTAGLPRAGRCEALARAALMGAQGNSGMILSQMVRGAAEALATGGAVDGPAVARALRRASEVADAAVRHPVEGTMLSVARAMAAAAEAALPADRDAVLTAVVDAGVEAVRATTDQLPALREAGVVDSGGLGVLILVQGLADALAGRPPRPAPAHPPSRPLTTAHPPSRHRFCTTFMLDGHDMDLDALEEALAAVGDSLLVMGDEQRVRVHVHTDTPEHAAAVAAGWGVVEGLKAEDMRRQEAERLARLAATVVPGGPVAVADGEGVRALIAGLGVPAVAPGAPLDDASLVLAVAPAPDVPGAEIVAVATLPAMLAAALAWDPDDDPAAAADAMRDAAAEVTSIGVDRADREALAGALAPALAEGAGLVTVLIAEGAGVAPAEVEAWVRALVQPGVEVEAHYGGQAAPALAIGVE